MTPPAWLLALIGKGHVDEGEEIQLAGQRYLVRNGILRAAAGDTPTQEHTSDAFGFKWKQIETFSSQAFLQRTREFLRERYGDIGAASWWDHLPEWPVILDAGCGAGVAATELFGDDRLRKSRYIGVDISEAIDVAAERFAPRGVEAAFIQTSLLDIPLPDESVDVILSEGVLHHTDDTGEAFRSLVRLLRPNGHLLFYVYRQKGPIREFTDDYVRDAIRNLEPDQAWDALIPLTKLGIALGELGVDVDVPVDVEILGIPAGPIDIQRLFYWYVLKAYHRPDWSLEENHHVNFDWFAPANAHRHTEAEVRGWCEDAQLEVVEQHVHLAGITTHARRPASSSP